MRSLGQLHRWKPPNDGSSRRASCGCSHAMPRSWSPAGSVNMMRIRRSSGRPEFFAGMADGKLDVVGCGSMVVDLFYRAPRIITADEKTILDAHDAGGSVERTQVGGLVLNHLGWARVLGLSAGIFGKMGDDRHAEFLRAGMDRFGIAQHLTLDGSSSSFATVIVDANGDRAIYMARGATAELRPEEIQRRHGAFIRRANIISTEVSQLPLPTVNAILAFARKHSIPSVLDVDLPAADAAQMLGTRADLERALRLATVLKPSK